MIRHEKKNGKAPVKSVPVPVDATPAAPAKKREPRKAKFVDLGYCTISERPDTITMEGIEFRVRKYDVYFTDGDSRNKTFGSYRNAASYAHGLNPDKPARAPRREASPYGTLAILRAVKTLNAICTRRDPSMCDALNAAVDSLNADLAWQTENGVDVAGILATEAARVDAVKAAKTAAKTE